jgi:hypothetical protein
MCKVKVPKGFVFSRQGSRQAFTQLQIFFFNLSPWVFLVVDLTFKLMPKIPWCLSKQASNHSAGFCQVETLDKQLGLETLYEDIQI